MNFRSKFDSTRSLLDPTLIIKPHIQSILIWSKLNWYYIVINILIPIFLFVVICFYLKKSYDNRQFQLFVENYKNKD